MKREAKQGRINLGNKGLTKLWNLNPNNLGNEAINCKVNRPISINLV